MILKIKEKTNKIIMGQIQKLEKLGFLKDKQDWNFYLKSFQIWSNFLAAGNYLSFKIMALGFQKEVTINKF